MDWLPRKRDQRYLFYKKISDHITAEGPKFGLTPADAATAKAIVDAMVTSMDGTDSAKAALGGAQEVERNTEAIKLPLFRAAVGLWKKMPGWAASGSEGVLDLKGAAENFDPSAYKPAFKAGIEAGKVKLEFSKKGVDALVFYTRLKGQTTWRRLAVDTHSPYYDTAPLAVAGVPEVREYMARGMVGDEEIGLDSDIVSVTFAG